VASRARRGHATKRRLGLQASPESPPGPPRDSAESPPGPPRDSPESPPGPPRASPESPPGLRVVRALTPSRPSPLAYPHAPAVSVCPSPCHSLSTRGLRSAAIYIYIVFYISLSTRGLRSAGTHGRGVEKRSGTTTTHAGVVVPLQVPAAVPQPRTPPPSQAPRHAPHRHLISYTRLLQTPRLVSYRHLVSSLPRLVAAISCGHTGVSDV
jgi:hypothetical protein